MKQLTRSQQALVDFLEKEGGDPSTANALRSGKLRFDNFDLTVNANIEGLNGLQKLINENLAKSIGVTNIKDGRMPKNEIAAFDRIRVSVATPDGVTDVTLVATRSTDHQAWPAMVVNSEVFVIQQGNEILRLPTDSCATAVDSDWAAGKADGKMLEEPLILEDERLTEIGFEFPSAVDAGTTLVTHAQIKFFGVKTKYKGRG